MPPSHSSPTRLGRRIAVAALVGLPLAVPLTTIVVAVIEGCGASVSAVYEGDVRFERCMALDWQKDVDLALRHDCWQEWSNHFTLGQTRDRIEYAKVQLASQGPTVATPLTSAAEVKPLLAIPDTTSVFAPPPMMMETADAGTLDAGPVISPKEACENLCADRSTDCLKLCKGPICGKACGAKRKICMDKCDYVAPTVHAAPPH